jgi:hypothetical protein
VVLLDAVVMQSSAHYDHHRTKHPGGRRLAKLAARWRDKTSKRR